MPSAVSDAGPLIHLAQINKLHLLKMLYNLVVITSEKRSLRHGGETWTC